MNQIRLVHSSADTEPDRTRRRVSTATSSFGTPPPRQSHDASAFYERFDELAAPDPDIVPTVFDGDDEIRVGDATATGLATNSVALVVTSPPYFAAKAYEVGQDSPQSFEEYTTWLGEVLAEAYRILEPGGRIAINVAGLGRRPYRSLPAVTMALMEQIGFLLRGEIVWVKADGSQSMAVGTWCSPYNPVMRDLTERVIVASKMMLHRWGTAGDREHAALPHLSDSEPTSWQQDTLDVWRIQPERASRVGHPAPFPIELPRRLIRLHTFVGDLVVDPMCGSGSTLLAAAELRRRFVGIDRDPNYVALANRRLGTVTPTLPFEQPKGEGHV